MSNALNRYAQVLALGGMHPAPMGDAFADFDHIGGYGDLDYGDNDDDLLMDEDDDDDDHIGGPARRQDRLMRRIAKLQMRMSAARNANQRDRLGRRIARLQMKLGKVQDKLIRRSTRGNANQMQRPAGAGRGYVNPAAAAAIGAGAGVGAGVLGGQLLKNGSIMQDSRDPGYYVADGAGQYADGLVYQNFVDRTPPAGEEVRIPLLITGAELATFSFPIGPATTTTVTATTAPITFAGFRVYGIDTIVNLQPNPEGLVSVTVNNVAVNGGINLLYAAQNASFAGQGSNGGGALPGHTIAGLRENPILEPNNTATITATIRQDAAITAAILNGTIQFALVARRISDNQATIR